MMPTEQTLLSITKEVDAMLAKIIIEHKISPLSVTGVVLARLCLMCEEMECREDMNELLETVTSRDLPKRTATLQ
jgi:thiamine phosphate synthase YjbQ (UPF0047 family)